MASITQSPRSSIQYNSSNRTSLHPKSKSIIIPLDNISQAPTTSDSHKGQQAIVLQRKIAAAQMVQRDSAIENGPK